MHSIDGNIVNSEFIECIKFSLHYDTEFWRKLYGYNGSQISLNFSFTHTTSTILVLHNQYLNLCTFFTTYMNTTYAWRMHFTCPASSLYDFFFDLTNNISGLSETGSSQSILYNVI